MLRFMKISLLTLMLTVSLAGSVLAVCPLGDLSGNCEVDLSDLLFFAGQWLEADSSREGLIAHWKLDGNADDPVGGNHGTVYGNPVWTIGQVDGALDLDGTGDYVDCGNDSSLDLINNFSISMWFNFNNTGQAILICKGNVPAYDSGGGGAYTIFCNGRSGILAFCVRESGDAGYAYTITAVLPNEWTHVVGTFSDGTIKIYKNGVPESGINLGTTTIHSNDGPLGIGAEGDGGMPCIGTIDDVRIYDRVLNEAEVRKVVSLGMPDPNCADLDDDGYVNLSDFTLLAKNWHEEGNPLVINEFLASNSSCNADPQGQYDDWLEIYNAGSIAVDIGGMYLTDDLSEPTKWRIPDNNSSATTIGPYGHLLIWADKNSEDGPLHVEFALGAGGEEIGLFDSDGNTLIDSIVFDDQVADVSFGRYPDASDTWRFMGFPTPGAQNNAGYLGQVADTEFSHNRGFYVEDFNVTITCDTPGAAIRYTTDSNAPTETHGNPYVAAIPIEGTTCLRAAAFKPGYLSSNADTQTYIFLDDVIQQPVLPAGFPSLWGSTTADYEMDPDVIAQDGSDLFGGIYAATIRDDLNSIPIMSLVMRLDDLFDATSGIYTSTNQWEDGVLWERPGSIELFYPDGSRGFQVNCGVRLYGGVGRREKKKTLRLLFKGIYGPAKLQYPLFGEDATDEFDTIILRAEFNDGWQWKDAYDQPQYARDEFIRRIQLASGSAAPHGNHVHLYINGLYWGMYNPVERPDAGFGASYFDCDRDDWDGLNSGSPVNADDDPERQARTLAAWNTMVSLTSAVANASTEEARTAAYQKVQGNNPDGTNNPAWEDYLDVDQYISYLIANYYGGNSDWPWKNYYVGRENSPDSTGFKFFTWDAEWVLDLRCNVSTNRINDNSGVAVPFQNLRPSKEFRVRVGDHVHKAFFNGGPLYVDTANPAWDPAHPERNRPAAQYVEIIEKIESPIVAESARWGDQHRTLPYTREAEWRNELNDLLANWFPHRSANVLQHFRDAGLYPNIYAPSFNQHGGWVSSGFDLTMDAPSGTIWYTLDGNDPRLPAGDSPPSTTLVAEDAAKRVLVPTGDIGDTWRTTLDFNDLGWNDGTPIIPGKTGGVGYDDNPTYDPYITYDVTAEMDGQNTTCYIRIPFTFNGDPNDFNFMTLKVRYDDGFVAYLNDDPNELTRRKFTGTPAWNSASTEQHSDSAAVFFENIPITSDHISYLRQGDNLLAIHGLNISTTSTDFLISVELVAGEGSPAGVSSSAIEYIPPTPVTLTESTHIKARVLDGITWSALNEATFAVGPVADNLRITEMMYHPQDTNNPDDPNAEFIELKNIGLETTINLSLVRFTEGINFTFPSLELTSGEYVLLVKDQAVFASRYAGVPPAVDILGPYEGRLANGGERICLEDAIGRTILDFSYEDDWRPITDGDGFSLTIIDPTNSDPNSWGEKDSWRASDYIGGSPGDDDPGVLPNPGSVVINEVMSHSHLTPDWIELYNTTGASINIGGWFLSDNDANLMKYRIAGNTWLPAGEYIVFYEDQHFNNPGESGCIVPFKFSENGEEACLSSAEDDILTGYREVEDFGASETGVSFGRYFKSSTGNYNFVAMDSNTPGWANAPPKVGPIVINEIMYHPDWPEGGSYNNDDYEYIELHNITGSPVTLYDSVEDEPWKLTDGIDFTFPASPNEVTIPAYGYLLVVKNPAAFIWRVQAESYPSVPLPPEKILGPYDGQLNNAGERVEISMPGDVDASGTRYYIRIDRVNYSDGSHPEDCPGGVDLWPTEADGGGKSLTRINSNLYGNDVINWDANEPTPGIINP